VAWKRGEFDRIDMFFRPLAEGYAGALDLRDDGALLAPASDAERVISTDTMVEGTHYLPGTDPFLLSQKLLRVNLSDLAAMGAVPECYFLSLSLPDSSDEVWLQGFSDGLSRDQTTFGLHLAGGDSTRTTGPAVLTITIVGQVPAGKALRRAAAKAGDLVMLSGGVGDGLLGLMAKQGGLGQLEPRYRDYLIGRYDVPNPRVRLARELHDLGAGAAADVSDGLLADLGHICTASHLAAEIDLATVPLSEAARAAVGDGYIQTLQLLAGGDDYELVFSLPPERLEALQQHLKAAGFPVPVCIGRFVAGWQERAERLVTVLDEQGTPLRIMATGWQHGAE